MHFVFFPFHIYPAVMVSNYQINGSLTRADLSFFCFSLLTNNQSNNPQEAAYMTNWPQFIPIDGHLNFFLV